jgi:hypothetical protein
MPAANCLLLPPVPPLPLPFPLSPGQYAQLQLNQPLCPPRGRRPHLKRRSAPPGRQSAPPGWLQTAWWLMSWGCCSDRCGPLQQETVAERCSMGAVSWSGGGSGAAALSFSKVAMCTCPRRRCYQPAGAVTAQSRPSSSLPSKAHTSGKSVQQVVPRHPHTAEANGTVVDSVESNLRIA